MSEGEFAQVSYIVTKGDQPLTISWTFHGNNITSDLGIITTPIGQRGSMLYISSAASHHRGKYTCTASNKAGTRKETASLNVNGNDILVTFVTGKHYKIIFCLEPPEVIPITFGKEVMSEGEFAQVSCIVSKGDQPLTISWTFHGNDITSDLGIITTPIGGRGSMLIISSAASHHRGSYTCTASNKAGTRQSTASLNVNGNLISL